MNTEEANIIDYSYKNFKGEQIVLLDPKEKKYTDANDKEGAYKETPILCSRGTSAKPYTERGWNVEYCGVWSDGLRPEVKEYNVKEKGGKISKKKITTYQVKVTFDLREREQMELVRILNVAHLAIAQALVDNKYNGKLGAKGLNPSTNESVEETGLKRLVYYPRDEDANVIKGVNLSQFLSLRGSPKSDRHTTFIDLDGNEIPWENLIKFDFFWVPLVNYTHIYSSGGKLSVQKKVESGIVIKRKPRGGAEKQNNTLKRLQNMYPVEREKLSSQNYAPNEEEEDHSTDTSESKSQETVDTPKAAPMSKLLEMASGGQNTPSGGQAGFQTDNQGAPTANAIHVPLGTQNGAQGNGAPQYTQTPAIPQNNTAPVTIPQNNTTPQYIVPATTPQNNTTPQYNPNTIQIPTNTQTAPQYNPNTTQIPTNTQTAPQYNPNTTQIPTNTQTIPSAMSGVPSVGTPQIHQQTQNF